MQDLASGFGGLALADILGRDGFFDRRLLANDVPAGQDAAPASLPHLAARAKHVIFLFMYGGPTQMDTWDYKPELQRRNGQTIEIETRRRSIHKQTLLGSRRHFRQHGESGLWGSDAFPYINTCLDDICVIKSLYADTFAHGSALLQMNSGRVIQGSPSLGSWLSYGLGNENQNLPGYIVMLDPRGGPIAGAANWSSGFMPAAFQGTHLRSGPDPILDLRPKHAASQHAQRDLIDTLDRFNLKHQRGRPGYSELAARISSYELAFQLQTTAPEALDISRETSTTHRLYGLDAPKPAHPKSQGPRPFGQQCLIARRLIERGVRFVQIYSGGGHGDQNWDAHGNVDDNLLIHAPEIDQPIAGLLTDLKQRGLLSETLVIWGGEFGRQAVAQNGIGRDHNPLGFLYWMAGGGIKGGYAHGSTDELGHRAATDRHHIRDLHATILNRLGLDHRRLTYLYGGLEHKLTGVQEAQPIQPILA